MPRLEFDAGGCFAVLSVAEDQAELGAVFLHPLGFGGVFEILRHIFPGGVVPVKDVAAQPALVLAGAGLVDIAVVHAVVAGQIVLIDGGLRAVLAVAALEHEHHAVWIAGGVLCFLTLGIDGGVGVFLHLQRGGEHFLDRLGAGLLQVNGGGGGPLDAGHLHQRGGLEGLIQRVLLVDQNEIGGLQSRQRNAVGPADLRLFHLRAAHG